MAAVVSCFWEITKENHWMPQFNYVFQGVSGCIAPFWKFCIPILVPLFVFPHHSTSRFHFSFTFSQRSFPFLFLFFFFLFQISHSDLIPCPFCLARPPPFFVPLCSLLYCCLSSPVLWFIPPLLHFFTWAGGRAAGLLWPCVRDSNHRGDVWRRCAIWHSAGWPHPELSKMTCLDSPPVAPSTNWERSIKDGSPHTSTASQVGSSREEGETVGCQMTRGGRSTKGWQLCKMKEENL